MEQFVHSVIALSGSADLPSLQNFLKSSEQTLNANQGALLSALAHLQPDAHSLGVLHILGALVKGGTLANQPAALTEFIDYTSNFLKQANAAQIQLAPELFCAVCRRYKDLVIGSGNPRRGIKPLEAALVALRHSSEVLTPVHADFFQLCLLARCYAAAAPVLDEDVYDVDPARTGMTPTDLFLYCYYGAMLLIGRKRHARALELLLTALTAPAMVGNAIVLACFKKYVLVSLIHAGSLPPLPKFTSSKVRGMVEEAKPYMELAQAYASHAPERLRKTIEQHHAAFAADGNAGLLGQVSSSLAMRNIQRLTQTYLSLPLQDIAAQVGLSSAAEAEMKLLRMVAAGEIHARLSADGMVTFVEDNEQYTSGGLAERVDGCIRRCMELNTRVAAANDMVSLDKAYLSKVTAKERRYDGGGGSGSFGAPYGAAASALALGLEELAAAAGSSQGL